MGRGDADGTTVGRVAGGAGNAPMIDESWPADLPRTEVAELSVVAARGGRPTGVGPSEALTPAPGDEPAAPSPLGLMGCPPAVALPGDAERGGAMGIRAGELETVTVASTSGSTAAASR